MTHSFLIQLALFFAVLTPASMALGRYMAAVFSRETWFLSPVEGVLFRAAGVDPTSEQTWTEYARDVLLFSFVTCVVSYVVLRAQTVIAAPAPWLAWNTAVSFTTNTDWQSYAGESTLGDVSQAVALTSQNFFSAGVGLAVAIALLRGLTRAESRFVGNFWVDLVRAHLYVLVPLSVVFAVVLVSQGVVQTFAGPVTATSLDGQTLTYVRGPVASQVAIKMLGTNGGGFFNANAAHPWENPTALSCFLQTLAIFVIPGGLFFTLGELTKRRGHGVTVYVTMAILVVVGAVVIAHAEQSGSPVLASVGIGGANLEGKEVRFGVALSALFAEVTTAASCGAVDAAHDSLTALGGLVPMLNIELGEIVFGGVGSGLYGALIYVVLTVFLSGLMIGRTPTYLGKKIDSRDVRFAAVYVLVPAFVILGGAAIALSTGAGRVGLLNGGPHGLSEALYALSSAAGNNGSAFAGLTAFSADHPVFYSALLGVAMFLGRFPLIVLVLAIAGNMAKKKIADGGANAFPISGPLFSALLGGVIVIVGALTFFPVLTLGPLAEHLRGMAP